MSIAITRLRGRVRVNLGDEDGRMAAPTGVQIDMALADVYIAMQAMLPPVTVSIPSGLTIAAGASTFSMPVTIAASGYGTGTVEYGGGIQLQLVSTGQFLRFLPFNDFNDRRNGQPSPTLSVPYLFTLYEDRTQVAQGLCYPGALAAQPCNIVAQIRADDLRDYVGTGGAEGFDTVQANLSREAASALVLRASSRLLKRMNADALAKRGINPSIADEWDAEANDLVYGESMRKSGLEGAADTQQKVR